MTRLTRLLPALALLVVLAEAAPGQEPIRMARTPDISPDGKLVAFSYLGDIWVVEAIGGTARPVTSHPAHDIDPVFSPDGRCIAFSSNRHGSYDVFVVPVQGGKPRRLTFDSASDIGLRLVARRQERPLRLDAQHRFPAELRAVHRARRGRPGPPHQRRRGQGGRLLARRAITSPMSAAPAPGIARAIAARPTTTSGSATPTAATTAS